jgi:hypothetical protein
MTLNTMTPMPEASRLNTIFVAISILLDGIETIYATYPFCKCKKSLKTADPTVEKAPPPHPLPLKLCRGGGGTRDSFYSLAMALGMLLKQ